MRLRQTIAMSVKTALSKLVNIFATCMAMATQNSIHTMQIRTKF